MYLLNKLFTRIGLFEFAVVACMCLVFFIGLAMSLSHKGDVARDPEGEIRQVTHGERGVTLAKCQETLPGTMRTRSAAIIVPLGIIECQGKLITKDK